MKWDPYRHLASSHPTNREHQDRGVGVVRLHVDSELDAASSTNSCSKSGKFN